MLLTICIILSVVLFFVVLLLASAIGLALKNADLCRTWQEYYAKLETGRDEETEAFQQEFLTMAEGLDRQRSQINRMIDHQMETQSKLNKAREDLEFTANVAEKHYDHCLPDVNDPDREKFEAIMFAVRSMQE